MIKKIILFVGILVLALGQSACWQNKGKKIPDVSNIKTSVDIQHFHEALFRIDTNDIVTGIRQLQTNFPAFFDLYFTNIIPFRQESTLTDAFYQNVRGFLTDPGIRHLADTTAIVFADFEPIKKEFHQAFQFYQYYFPDKRVPQLYPMISEFGYGTFIFPVSDTLDGIGIGLDMFLGPDYPYWRLARNNPTFSQYLTRTFNKDHLVKKSMDALIEDLLNYVPGDRLIDLMIFNGKKLYILDQLLPYAPDSVKLEYTAPQTKWVLDNETQIWAHFLKEELLYESSIRKIKKLVDHSPSSPGMPPEAPGRTANFMGWKIVETYMKRYPETTLTDLIRIQDAQTILDKARYKPR